MLKYYARQPYHFSVSGDLIYMDYIYICIKIHHWHTIRKD